jgi:hypothetical protein
LIPDAALPHLTNARRMPIRGIIVLHVQIEQFRSRVRFHVAPEMEVPCILVCSFIRRHVKCIYPGKQRVEMNEGGSVHISQGLSACHSVSEQRRPTASTKVRLARPVVVPARCEAHVEVTTAVEGLCGLTHHSKLSAGPVTLASGVAEICPHIPFRVRVINPSERPYTLPKGMLIGMASPRPLNVINVGAVEEAEDPDMDLPHASHPEGLTTAPPPRPPSTSKWEEEVDLSHLSSEERQAVLKMLEPHRHVWDGHL